jgi:hypothetical protein
MWRRQISPAQTIREPLERFADAARTCCPAAGRHRTSKRRAFDAICIVALVDPYQFNFPASGSN